ncbi:MAG TPA: LLM class flavin-dependent oxidoreductase [Streptosporangiaceae bacterium]|nr:LLM class flavin-dependent oxidoreductase [Streptosporangiaceae bacterium]
MTRAQPPPLHLAVALDGAGWHPAAWREPDARPAELLSARYWSDLVAEAEAGYLDFVTWEDGLALEPRVPGGVGAAASQAQGRLDAVLIAARVAPLTRGIGLIPTVVVTHTEPFHIAKAIATLDYVSQGRAGVRVRVSARADEAAHVGRRAVPGRADLLAEAADYVEVLRRLWDSWEDDAEIRDVATGRFVDIDRLHYIDFEGRWFSVRGPSITPRPPQGQPLVAALAHQDPAWELAAGSADLAFVTPHDAAEAAAITTGIGQRAAAAGRAAGTVRVLADLVVFLDDREAAAAARRARLDELAGAAYASDAEIFAGTPAQLADLLLDWQAAGLAGFRLRPAALPHDLTQISRGLVPELQRRGAFRPGYPAGTTVPGALPSTLRGLLGLARPANRYAA